MTFLRRFAARSARCAEAARSAVKALNTVSEIISVPRRIFLRKRVTYLKKNCINHLNAARIKTRWLKPLTVNTDEHSQKSA